MELSRLDSNALGAPSRSGSRKSFKSVLVSLFVPEGQLVTSHSAGISSVTQGVSRPWKFLVNGCSAREVEDYDRLNAQTPVGMGLSKQGWGYMLQWFNDGTMVKAGFTTAGLPGVLAAFARHNGHRLVVVKAWEATKEDYELIADRLKPFVGSNGWMKVTPGLQRLVREDLPCDSLKAKSQFKRKCGEQVVWMSWLHPSQEFIPMSLSSPSKVQRKGAQSLIRSSGF